MMEEAAPVKRRRGMYEMMASATCNKLHNNQIVKGEGVEDSGVNKYDDDNNDCDCDEGHCGMMVVEAVPAKMMGAMMTTTIHPPPAASTRLSLLALSLSLLFKNMKTKDKNDRAGGCGGY